MPVEPEPDEVPDEPEVSVEVPDVPVDGSPDEPDDVSVAVSPVVPPDEDPDVSVVVPDVSVAAPPEDPEDVSVAVPPDVPELSVDVPFDVPEEVSVVVADEELPDTGARSEKDMLMSSPSSAT